MVYRVFSDDTHPSILPFFKKQSITFIMPLIGTIYDICKNKECIFLIKMITYEIFIIGVIMMQIDCFFLKMRMDGWMGIVPEHSIYHC